MATNYDGNEIEFKNQLPLLPVRDIVIYPYMILPLFVGRDASIKAVEHALSNTDRMILLASQKDISKENPSEEEIYRMGTVAMIMRMRKLPDGRIKILVQGLSKVVITEFVQNKPFYEVKTEKVASLPLELPLPSETLAFMRMTKEQLERIVSLGRSLSPDILMVLEDIHDPGRLADLIASHLNLKVEEGQQILETIDPLSRLKKIHEILARELEIQQVQAKLKNPRDNQNLSKDHFLKEQIKAIRQELGDKNDDAQDEFGEIKDKILARSMPADVEKEALKQLARLEKMHPDSSESSILRTYLEWLYELPWNVNSKENFDLNLAKETLDEDHFELTKIKDRILEYLAVRSLKKGSIKGPILCFSGPPGVGKTSLGKSIAKATGREFVRISLGGVKDEAEIRGHRRTYVGAMPGRFIQAIKQAGTANPVVMLDEVDKIGSDYRGDPSAALLEVLDPEQNNSFRDHYLNVPFDLSNIMFIATANEIGQIPGPLRDRMEIIQLSGYGQEEKLAISRRYLVPKQMDENGVSSEHIEFTDEGLTSIIRHFTAEAGLRNLERQIGTLCRKVAKKIATGESAKTHIIPQTVEELLGPPIYTSEDQMVEDEVGVATGLAWTAVGGEVLYIEVSKMKGKGLTTTGKLGDVMKESAIAAIGHLKSNARDYGIDEDFFDQHEIHVHIPAGATPKDGPSAGITMALAICSLATDTPISRDVAMTGEITLKGKVLPIGGLKEKALAAMRHGIKTVIIPWKNRKDLIDIPEEFRRELEFIPVRNFAEVLEIALVKSNNKVNKSSNHKRKVLPEAKAA